MPTYYADDRARENRLAAIRARRGTADREAFIAEIAEKKQQDKQAAAKRKSSAASERKTRENSEQYHGHSWDEWDLMRDKGLAFITERAARREFTSATELWAHLVAELGKPLGNSHFQTPALLEHVGMKSLDESGLLASALVIDDPAAPSPGAGLFSLAAAKNLLPQADAPKSTKDFTMSEAQRAFWQSQVDALFAKFATS